MVFCFFGDSLTLGFGDETGLGWTGRITNRLMTKNSSITSYNLGIRKDTSTLLEQRWRSEAGLRKLDDVEFKLIFSFGVADVINQIQTEDTLAAAFILLTKAMDMGDILMVGPTPIVNALQCEEISLLSELLGGMCHRLGVPFISTIDAMTPSAVYAQALADGDTVHPTGTGYAELADYICETNEARTFFGLE